MRAVIQADGTLRPVQWGSGGWESADALRAQQHYDQLSRLSATKASLDAFHAPVAYFLGGPTDIAYANGKDDFSRLKTVPAFLGSIHSGHAGTYMHPGGGWFGEVGRRLAEVAPERRSGCGEILRRRGLHPLQEPDLGSRQEKYELGSRCFGERDS
jgi:hypothetical protein